MAFNDNVTLSADTSITATSPNGTVTFNRGLDGGFNLSIASFNTAIGGNVGAITPLAGLTTDSVGSTRFPHPRTGR